MIFIILLGAMILGYFLAATRLPFELAEIVGGLPVDRYVILVLIMVIFLLLGCVMDSLAVVGPGDSCQHRRDGNCWDAPVSTGHCCPGSTPSGRRETHRFSSASLSAD
jgi:hypothetical protein